MGVAEYGDEPDIGAEYMTVGGIGFCKTLFSGGYTLIDGLIICDCVWYTACSIYRENDQNQS